MTTIIKAQNIELTLAIKDYTEKRMNALYKYIGTNSEISIDIEKTTEHHRHGEFYKASVNINTALGKNYFASAQKVDIYQAIDEVRDELIKILSNDKKRNDSIWKKSARKIKNILKGLR